MKATFEYGKRIVHRVCVFPKLRKIENEFSEMKRSWMYNVYFEFINLLN